MLLLSQPSLSKRLDGVYHCPDIRALYHWLEAQDYHYYGSYGSEQYGRFARTEIALGETPPVERSSSIEVHLNGLVVATDDRAQQLLDTTSSRDWR